MSKIAGLTKTQLEDLYYDESITVAEVARRLGCSERTLRNYLEFHDIDLRMTVGIHKNPPAKTTSGTIGEGGCPRCPLQRKCNTRQKAGYTGPVPCEDLLDFETKKNLFDTDPIYFIAKPSFTIRYDEKVFG